MIAQSTIDTLQTLDGVAWITALKTEALRHLHAHGPLQLGLFDERNLCAFTDPAFPGERLIACRNPDLATRRGHTRASWLTATEGELAKVAKHFTWTIDDRQLTYVRNTAAITAEAALDGIYVIRTNLPVTRMDDAETVHTYKSLSQVERAFRSLKTIDVHVRPIHHRTADRVRSHIFLCVLAYYVEWHVRDAWRPLLFADEDQAAKATRDPVARATRSVAADQKAATHRTTDGTPVQGFRTLLQDLSTIVRNRCRTRDVPDAPTFELTTTPTPAQRRAFDLIQQIV